MKCTIELENCTLLGAGAEGSVYLTPEGYALKSFNTIKGAINEASILEDAKDSRFFPNVIVRISNIVIRECVEGDNILNFIEKKGLSYKLSCEIIDLVEDFKMLKFKRVNIRNAHIFVNNDETIMVIDPRKPYKKVTPYPKDIIKVLLKQKVFDDFLKYLLEYRPDLLDYWIDGYDYVVHRYRHVLRYG